MAEPIKQAILGDMFDEETAAELAGQAFPKVDEDLPTDYRCPRCSYSWSGAPKPKLEVDEEGDGES